LLLVEIVVGVTLSKYISVIILLAILLTPIAATAQWGYTRTFSDDLNDFVSCPSDGCQAWMDIMEVWYAFNETHVAVNTTVASSIPIPIPSGISRLDYRILIDSDNNSGTGARVLGIGADYRVLIRITSSISTTLQKREGDKWINVKTLSASLYTKHKDSDTIGVTISKEDIKPLSGEIGLAVRAFIIIGTSTYNTDNFGGRELGPVPIPEPALIAPIAVAAVAAISMGIITKKRG